MEFRTLLMVFFILQLPLAQLENALNRTPALKAPLVAHASQPDIRSSLPRFIEIKLFILRIKTFLHGAGSEKAIT